MYTLIILAVLQGQPITVTVPGIVTESMCAAGIKRATSMISGGGAFCVQTSQPDVAGSIVLGSQPPAPSVCDCVPCPDKMGLCCPSPAVAKTAGCYNPTNTIPLGRSP